LSVTMITHETLEMSSVTIFSGHHPMVEREAKFENGCGQLVI